MTDPQGLTWRQFEDMMSGEERPRRRGMLPELGAPYVATLKQYQAQMAAGAGQLNAYEQAALAASYKRIGDELVHSSLLETDK